MGGNNLQEMESQHLCRPAGSRKLRYCGKSATFRAGVIEDPRKCDLWIVVNSSPLGEAARPCLILQLKVRNAGAVDSAA
jgi:hypothetical protein